MLREKFHYRVNRVKRFLACADIAINGDHPWDLQVHNENFYWRVLTQGSMGLGESYMDGWWDCRRLDDFFYRIFNAGLDCQVRALAEFSHILKARLFNLQKESRAFDVGRRHYDKGNDLYKAMLDKRMIYSCGYWKNAATLDEAQEAKLDMVCRKLHLRPGLRVLDIGCGWGGMAKFAAERYQVKVVGVTVSEEQARLATASCQGLPVEFRLQDYRQLNEPFDRILSLGMFEHVGKKNYRTFMRIVRRCLDDNGLFLLHTIGGNHSQVDIDPWIEHYIFPNAMLPSAKQICQGFEGIFVLEDWHNFGADYDTTLLHWFKNFDAHWPSLQDKYDQRFYRMWKYYLLSCAGSFRARKNQVWQILLSPQGIPGGYESPWRDLDRRRKACKACER